MSQQIMIIGLGQFGMALSRTLSEKGVEVLAVDTRKELVEEASTFVDEAVLLDATIEQELARLEPRNRDVCVCAIGDDSKEASIICTALLRQMGAPVVVARSNDVMHQRILHLVGAHQVVNPEQEFGKRFANKLLYRSVIADTNLGDDLHLTEIRIQPQMVGKTLATLALPKNHGVTVVGVRNHQQGKITPPSPDHPLEKENSLIIVSSEDAIQDLVNVYVK